MFFCLVIYWGWEGSKYYKEQLITVPSQLLYERFNINGSQHKITNPEIMTNKVIIVGADLDKAYDKDKLEIIKRFFPQSLLVWLPDINIYGNGHMMMLENNSSEIANTLINILDKEIGV
jgi:hypothetical protein